MGDTLLQKTFSRSVTCLDKRPQNLVEENHCNGSEMTSLLEGENILFSNEEREGKMLELTKFRSNEKLLPYKRKKWKALQLSDCRLAVNS
jgi:hypothetical protein